MDIGNVGNVSMLQVDIFKYLQKLPEYTTYANLYNQFWIQGFAIKCKLLGTTSPIVATNTRG